MGLTALTVAIFFKNYQMMTQLLEQNADVSLTFSRAETVIFDHLSFARCLGDAYAVQTLLNYGAEVTMPIDVKLLSRHLSNKKIPSDNRY
mgnify:FL=1